MPEKLLAEGVDRVKAERDRGNWRRYYQRHKEAVRARHRAYNSANKAKVAAHKRTDGYKAIKRCSYIKNRHKYDERRKVTSRAWRIANRDKVNARARLAKTTAHARAMRRAWLEKNKARIQVNARERWLRNMALLKAWRTAYNKTPAGKAAQMNGKNRRRARVKNCESVATLKEVRRLLAAAKRCAYCLAKFSKVRPATLDHVMPLSKGGAHRLDNFAVCCRSCNSMKNAKDPLAFAQEIGRLLI